MTKYNKAWAALIGSLLTLLAAFGIDIPLSDEVVTAIGSLLTTVMVWLVPNIDKTANQPNVPAP